MASRLRRGRQSRASQSKQEEDTAVEHISDRQDHDEHETKISHTVMPLSSAVSPLQRRGSTGPRRRLSVNEDEIIAGTMNLANSQKFNSTSTLFVDSTVSAPDLEETLQCVALALHYVIEDGHQITSPKLYLNIFDEQEFPLSEARVRRDYAKRIPTSDRIHHLLAKLFHAAQLTAECAIITLVYINRVIAYTGLTLQACNWKRVLLGAVLMASKVWDDQAVWNVDFCTILPRVKVEEMNDLERFFLEMLDFNIDVDSSVYAKYYFELRDLAEKYDKAFPLDPLDQKTARRLEATSHARSQALQATKMRAAKSLDGETFVARAILS
eukprot:TRINITY_DN9094_c0_g3_i3.p1 TRINITY_DN9094_c0_g3~~TRINITY_DN9094_c0_g3_i3.p1  ORF type:complete len:326 (+),score=73.76 TRINITY_DN9094_c0_g3_i3:181-1158(+)